jgi:hypothetical protein
MEMPLNKDVLDVFSQASLEEIYSRNEMWIHVCLDEQKQEVINALRFSIKNTIVTGDTKKTMGGDYGWPCFMVQVNISPAMLAPISNMDVDKISIVSPQPHPIINKISEDLFWTIVRWPNHEIVSVLVEANSQFGEAELENLRGLGLDIDPASWEPVQTQNPGGSYNANLQIGGILDAAAHDKIERLILNQPE